MVEELLQPDPHAHHEVGRCFLHFVSLTGLRIALSIHAGNEDRIVLSNHTFFFLNHYLQNIACALSFTGFRSSLTD